MNFVSAANQFWGKLDQALWIPPYAEKRLAKETIRAWNLDPVHTIIIICLEAWYQSIFKTRSVKEHLVGVNSMNKHSWWNICYLLGKTPATNYQHPRFISFTLRFIAKIILVATVYPLWIVMSIWSLIEYIMLVAPTLNFCRVLSTSQMVCVSVKVHMSQWIGFREHRKSREALHIFPQIAHDFYGACPVRFPFLPNPIIQCIPHSLGSPS